MPMIDQAPGLEIHLGTQDDLEWAQKVVASEHYLKQRVDPRARPMVYVITFQGWKCGLIMAGIPHATKCRQWWGYPGLPTQWQVLDLCRIWLSSSLQRGGYFARPELLPGFIDRRGVFRPTVASWAIGQVFERIQEDRISLWPPVFPQEPYHIRLIISYHDPEFHRGALYREMGWLPMYTDDEGNPVPGSSGKFGWCWPLPEPAWEWQDIEIQRPRTMRMALEV